MPGESPVALVERLATAKALTAGRRLVDAHAEAAVELLVVGADTIVALENEIMGKPAHADEAYAMLLRPARPPPSCPHRRWQSPALPQAAAGASAAWSTRPP